MSDTSSPSSQAEVVELVEFAKVAQNEWREGAATALLRATGQVDWAFAEILRWADYFQMHALLGNPKAVDILTKFRHEYIVLKLTK